MQHIDQNIANEPSPIPLTGSQGASDQATIRDKQDAARKSAELADSAASAAWLAGNFQLAARHLLQAEQHAAASGDMKLLIRQLVRAEAVVPAVSRHRAIVSLAGLRSVAELIEEFATEFLQPCPATTRSEPDFQSTPPPREIKGGATSKPKRKIAKQSTAVCRAPAVAASVAVPVALGLGSLAPHGSSTPGYTPWLSWAEQALGAGAAALHVLKTLIVDPISHAMGVSLWLFERFTSVISASDTWRDAGWLRTTVFFLGTALALALVCGAYRAYALHVGRADNAVQDRIVFSGRRLWYSFHRILMITAGAAILSVLASRFLGELFALPFDILATGGLFRLIWLCVPGARDRLLVTERPGEPRQARVEVLGGVVRINHSVFAVHELRAAELGPTRWWDPSQDIALRKLDGSYFLLRGFVGPRRAAFLVSELNRLIRGVPPLPFSSSSVHDTYENSHGEKNAN